MHHILRLAPSELFVLASYKNAKLILHILCVLLYLLASFWNDKHRIDAFFRGADMVFACQGCKTNYRLSDDRIKGKVLRFTCPKCGQPHLLRDPAMYANPVEAVTDETSRRSADAPAPETVQAKPTVSMPTIGPRPTTQTGALPAMPVQDATLQETWYAVKKGERIGPFSTEQILRLLLDGTLHERSFVWRPTMSAWKRMTDCPELSGVLEQYIEQKRKKQEEQDGATPPPLPAVQDQPAIVQTVQQVQKPEAESPDKQFPPTLTQRTETKTALEVQLVRPESSAPFGAESAQPAEQPRKTFFGKVLVLDEARWPETPSVLKEVRETPSVLRHEAPKLSEFSVLMRVSQASRKRAIVTYTIGVFLLGAAVGAVAFLVFSRSPAERANVSMGFRRDQPTFQQVLYTVPKKEARAPEDQVAQQPQRLASTTTKPRRVEKPEAQQPEPPANKFNIGEVAPELKDEFEKYSTLAQATQEKPTSTQVAMDFKPKTLTELPSRKITQENLDNIFKLNWKRLTTCKLHAIKHKDATMTVSIQFVIGKDGDIKNLVVQQEGGFLEEKVLKCIAQNIKALRFPPQDEEIPVSWPLIF